MKSSMAKLLMVAVLLSPLSSWASPLSSAKPLCNEVNSSWQSIVGLPYVWGGSQLSHKGFDCSGAIHHVSKKMGRPIIRTTSRKMWLMIDGKSKHWSNAYCGDLIWFTFTPNRPYGHIGMHSFPNQFWHSGASTGPTKAYLIRGRYWDGIFEGSKAYGGEN